MKPFAIVALFALAAGACTGDGEAVSVPTTKAQVKAAREAVAEAAGPELVRARLQAGTRWESGALARFCSGGECTADPTAEPADFVEVPESRVLLLVVPEAPEQGRVDVLRRASGERVMRRTLSGSTSMPMKAPSAAGAYVVRLRASWDDREAVWLFGVRVPA